MSASEERTTAPEPLPKRLAWLAVVALAVLVPVATSNFTALGFRLPFAYDQTSLPKWALVLVLTWGGMLAWTLGSLRTPQGWRLPKGWMPLAGLLAWMTLTTATSIAPAQALFGWYTRYEGLVTYLTYAALFVLVIEALPPSKWVVLARAMACTGGVLSLYGLAQYAGLDPTDWLAVTFETNRAFATFGNPDFFASYLIFPMAMAAALVFGETDRRYRIGAGAAFVLCLLAQVAGLSRGGWIGSAIALGLVAFGLSRKGVRVWRWVAVAVAVIVVAALVLSLVSPFNPLSRLATLAQGGETALSGRLDIWSAGWQAFTDRPVFGSGLSTFRDATVAYAVAGPDGVPDDAHNYPLQLLVTTGVPGLVLFTLFAGVVLVASAPHAFGRKSGDVRALCYLAAWAGVVGYLVSLLAGISLPGTSVLLWIGFGVLAAPLSEPKGVVAPAVRWTMVAATAIVCVVTAVLLVRALYADWAFLQARDAARRGGDRVGFARLAVRLNSLPERYQLELKAAEAQVK
ncbi:MAG: O-antigen ligase family protein [Coriobacteriales bacterium]|nr:O-antigen ligase family protein [Coriobacteriales bacterium]